MTFLRPPFLVSAGHAHESAFASSRDKARTRNQEEDSCLLGDGAHVAAVKRGHEVQAPLVLLQVVGDLVPPGKEQAGGAKQDTDYAGIFRSLQSSKEQGGKVHRRAYSIGISDTSVTRLGKHSARPTLNGDACGCWQAVLLLRLLLLRLGESGVPGVVDFNPQLGVVHKVLAHHDGVAGRLPSRALPRVIVVGGVRVFAGFSHSQLLPKLGNSLLQLCDARGADILALVVNHFRSCVQRHEAKLLGNQPGLEHRRLRPDVGQLGGHPLHALRSTRQTRIKRKTGRLTEAVVNFPSVVYLPFTTRPR